MTMSGAGAYHRVFEWAWIEPMKWMNFLLQPGPGLFGDDKTRGLCFPKDLGGLEWESMVAAAVARRNWRVFRISADAFFR